MVNHSYHTGNQAYILGDNFIRLDKMKLGFLKNKQLIMQSAENA